MDLSNYQEIRDADEAHTAGELCQYVQNISWMCSVIPLLLERSVLIYAFL